MTLQQDAAHLGAILKKRRMEKNLSLKEIENATSIRMHFLDAIENGEVEKLISPIYLNGFIRKYATHLELDVEALLKQFPPKLRQEEGATSEKQDFTLGIGSVEVRGGSGGGVKWLPNLLWVSLSVLIICASYLLAKYFGIL